MENFNTKKIFLYLLSCSIGLSALMGIWAILSGEFGETQGKVLFTTLTVVGTSILGLACGAFLESPRALHLKAVPLAGILFTVLCAFACFWLIWGNSGNGSDGIFKLSLVSSICAFSLAQLSLLSMARLAKRFRWSLIAVYIVITALNLIICPIIIFELNGGDNLISRLIGVLSIIAASLTVMIPIFHWLSRSEFIEFETRTVENIEAQIAHLKTEISRLEKQRKDILSAEARI